MQREVPLGDWEVERGKTLGASPCHKGLRELRSPVSVQPTETGHMQQTLRDGAGVENTQGEVSTRVDELRAYGNAVVPAQGAYALRLLLAAHQRQELVT